MLQTICLSTAYLAPVDYYSQLNSGKPIVIERYCHYIKQTFRNRCVIVSANGPLTLSIPIEKPSTTKCLTKDIRISEHGNWRHIHWNAILSAYRSTPFFDYYEDDFRPFYEKKQAFLFDFNESLRIMICELIDIYPKVAYSSFFQRDLSPETMDLRESIHPKKDHMQKDIKPYDQVQMFKFGFIPYVSIIDLLFNMGSESVFYLQKT